MPITPAGTRKPSAFVINETSITGLETSSVILPGVGAHALVVVAAEDELLANCEVTALSSTSSSYSSAGAPASQNWVRLVDRASVSTGSFFTAISVFVVKDAALISSESLTVTMASPCQNVVARYYQLTDALETEDGSEYVTANNQATSGTSGSVSITPNNRYISAIYSFIATGGTRTITAGAGVTTDASQIDGTSMSLHSGRTGDFDDPIAIPHSSNWTFTNDRWVAVAVEIPFKAPVVYSYEDDTANAVETLTVNVPPNAETGDTLVVTTYNDSDPVLPLWNTRGTKIGGTGVSWHDKPFEGETSFSLGTTGANSPLTAAARILVLKGTKTPTFIGFTNSEPTPANPNHAIPQVIAEKGDLSVTSAFCRDSSSSTLEADGSYADLPEINIDPGFGSGDYFTVAWNSVEANGSHPSSNNWVTISPADIEVAHAIYRDQSPASAAATNIMWSMF